MKVVEDDDAFLNRDKVVRPNPDGPRIQERSQRRELLVDEMIALDDGETDMDALNFV